MRRVALFYCALIVARLRHDANPARPGEVISRVGEAGVGADRLSARWRCWPCHCWSFFFGSVFSDCRIRPRTTSSARSSAGTSFPFPVDVDRFLLDATGAVLAEHVTVYRDAARKSVMFQVDEVRVGIAWLSWWRGGGVINGANISNADVRYPVGSETADFHEVNADIAFDGRDIKIENAQARFLESGALSSGERFTTMAFRRRSRPRRSRCTNGRRFCARC